MGVLPWVLVVALLWAASSGPEGAQSQNPTDSNNYPNSEYSLDIYPRHLPAYERSYPTVSNATVAEIYFLHPTVMTNLEVKRDYEARLVAAQRTVNLEVPSLSGRAMFHTPVQPQRARDSSPFESYFEEMTQQLQTRMGLSYSQVAQTQNYYGPATGFCDSRYNYLCPTDPKYRTIDGTCNNLRHPAWGSSYTCYRRLLPAAYSDGISSLRRSLNGDPLPNPRILSLVLHGHTENEATTYTHTLMQWGQFVAHDLTQTKPYHAVGQEVLDCCSQSSDPAYPSPSYNASYPQQQQLHPQCLPISLPQNDPFYSNSQTTCLNFVRSAPCASCKLGPRDQTNLVTSYLDASTVYGSSEENRDYLRDSYDPAKLAVQQTNYGYLLPRNRNPDTDQCSDPSRGHYCFAAGDYRNNQHPGLAVIHTIFVRYHNKLVDILRGLNPHWDHNVLFEEARRIIGAQIQFITLREYLHLVIGPTMMSFYDLWTLKSGHTFYADSLNAGLFTETATAAYRYGHSLVQTDWWQVNLTSGEVGSAFNLQESFFDPTMFRQTPVDGCLMGMVTQPAMKFDPGLISTLTQYLYKVKGQNHGFDLAAANIYRSRDHGLQGYTRYLEQCFGVSIKDWQDLLPFMEQYRIDNLRKVYQYVTDVDLWPGGLSERLMKDGVVGPTFACIIGTQYYYLKFGDRFYMEHGGLPSSFTDRQLRELRKTWLSWIYCQAGDHVTWSTLDVFQPPSEDNPIIPCSQITDMDWSAWFQNPPVQPGSGGGY